MAKTYTDLFSEVRDNVKTISLEELKKRIDAGDKFTLVDVREKDEVRLGYIPGAIHVPRGFLEMQIESRVPDRSAEVIVESMPGK